MHLKGLGRSLAGCRRNTDIESVPNPSYPLPTQHALLCWSYSGSSELSKALVVDTEATRLIEMFTMLRSDCLDVHARAAMRVDVATVQEMIVETLPGQFSKPPDRDPHLHAAHDVASSEHCHN